jgi:serine/threonine protein phosphatase PrpC
MGCSGSGNKPTVEASRRRLSVGQVDSSGAEASTEESQKEDRGALQALNDQKLLELIQSNTGVGGRKFSLGSATDQGKTSFANKSTKEEGDDKGENTGIGFTCRKGLKPESPNQDSWSVVKTDDFALYGVFDGHGQKGHDVSNMVKDDLFKLILKDQRFGIWQDSKDENDENEKKKEDDVVGAVKDAFKKMQNLITTADQMKKVSAQLSGTTASIVIHHFKKNKLIVAHVADSTVCMASWKDDKKGALSSRRLTRDHKPDLPDERSRIEKAGGRVVFDGYANHRIYAKNGRYPGLNMSRCLGDLLGHQDAGVSCEPEISVVTLDPKDHILFLCSDGVWEFMEPGDATNVVFPKYNRSKCQQAADALAKEAWDRWIKEEGGAVVDDITAVLIYLDDSNESNQ